MSAIRIFRPEQEWSASPATLLPTGLLVRLFKPHWNLTVVLDGRPAGKIGIEEAKIFQVEPGEHRLYMRFVLLRRSTRLRVFLAQGQERKFLCGTNGIGWPTLREASPQDAARIQGTSIGE